MDLKAEKARSVLNHLLSQWDRFSDRLQNFKKDELKADLFSQIDFLSQVDEERALITFQLAELEKYRTEMMDPAFSTDQINSFKTESQNILKEIKPKLETAKESYEEMAEEVLFQCQDRIAELTDAILEHRQSTRDLLKDELNFELDEENLLRELRDSLETYREIRLESLEEETSDPLLNQLDSLMVACESALLIDESSL